MVLTDAMPLTAPAPLLTIDVPDLAHLSDEALEALLPLADGAWSRQTRDLLARFGLDKLNLNSNWADVPRHWACPCCLRPKTGIARPSDNGVLLCQLEWHHDHLRDWGKRVLRTLLPPSERTSESRALDRAIDACKDLTMRFHTTLICNDCNTAEGQAKAMLAGDLPGDFSFSPSEIARFITSAPHRMHEVDREIALVLWREARPDVERRLAFLDVLRAQLEAGGLRVEGSPPRYDRGVYVPALLGRVAERQGQPAESFYRLTSTVLERSVRQDGFGVAKRPRRPAASRPTARELAAYTASQPPEQPWRRVPTDWRCEVCRRDQAEVLRKSGKGAWTGKIHRHAVYLTDDDPNETFWRTGWFDETPVIRSHRIAYICQDCRLVITDLRTLDARYPEDSLTIADLRQVLTAVEPNRRHDTDMVLARSLADEKDEHLARIADYHAHRSLSQSLTIDLTTLTGHFRMDLEEALNTLVEQVVTPGFEGAQLRPRLEWMLEEGRRFRREDLSRDAYLKPINRTP